VSEPADKTTILEVYKQETESLRFFDDMLFKTNFFVIAGILAIDSFAISKSPLVGSNLRLFCAVLVLVAILAGVLITLHVKSKHVSRMRRLSIVVSKLSLVEMGIYKAKKPLFWDLKTLIILCVYLVLALGSAAVI